MGREATSFEMKVRESGEIFKMLREWRQMEGQRRGKKVKMAENFGIGRRKTIDEIEGKRLMRTSGKKKNMMENRIGKQRIFTHLAIIFSLYIMQILAAIEASDEASKLEFLPAELADESWMRETNLERDHQESSSHRIERRHTSKGKFWPDIGSYGSDCELDCERDQFRRGCDFRECKQESSKSGVCLSDTFRVSANRHIEGRLLTPASRNLRPQDWRFEFEFEFAQESKANIRKLNLWISGGGFVCQFGGERIWSGYVQNGTQLVIFGG